MYGMGTCLGADVWYGRRYAFGTRRYAFELNSVTYFAPKFRKRETEKIQKHIQNMSQHGWHRVESHATAFFPVTRFISVCVCPTDR